MSYYMHILICWEGGHIVGYADPEKIKSIAGNESGNCPICNKYTEIKAIIARTY